MPIYSGAGSTTNVNPPYDFTEDSPHVSGDAGAFILAVRNDAGTALSADGEYIPFTTDSSGALRVSASVSINAEYAEDSIHASGDIGSFILAVRNDAGTPLAADGDYIPFTTDSSGALRVAASVSINAEYPEDSLHVSGDIGSFILAVRNDAGTPLAADGEYIPITTDSSGALRVAASVAINYAYAEDSVHVSGDIGSFSLGVRNDAAATLTSADGDYSPFATDPAGRIGISDLGGSISIDDNAGSITVDGTVAVTQSTSPWVVSGTVTAETNFDYPEDSPHVSGDSGALILAVRRDSPSSFVSADGDYTPFSINATGALRVSADTVYDYPEDDSHSSGDSGVFVLAVRNDAAATLTSTNGDYSALATDAAGRIGISDLGGSISIDDNAGSITVDGAVTVSGTVTADTNYDYNEDTLHASGDIGAFVLAVRNDAGTPLAADGEYIPFTTDSSGSLRVAASVTINSEKAEDSTHTNGDIGSFVLGVRNDAAAVLTSTNGDYSPFSTDDAGRIGITDLGGSISIDDNGGSITVDGAVTVSGTVTADTNFDYSEDTLHASGDMGAFVLAVRNDAGTPLAADGEYIPFTTDSSGSLRVAASVTINSEKAEDSVHTTGDIGSFTLGVRNDAAAALTSTDGDYSPFATDSAGRIGITDLGGSITVDGTVEIGATSLAALESITVQNGAGGAAVNIQDGGNSITVDGTVSITGTVTTGDNKTEDVAHTTGDIGSFILGVRNDAGTPLAGTTGDYIPITTDASGDVFVTTGRGGSLANGAETSVTNTAAQIIAANTARKKLIVQNTGANNIRVGITGVTNSTGFRLVPGGSLILDMPNCPTNAIFAIREGGQNSTAFAQEIT